MEVDDAVRSRSSLILMLSIVASLMAFYGHSRTRETPVPQAKANEFALRPDEAHAAELARLESLTRRRPTAADWKRVRRGLEHPSWRVVTSSLQVMRVHRHAQLAAAELAVLRRAVSSPATSHAAEYRARDQLVGQILETIGTPHDPALTRTFVQLVQSRFDGRTRARALQSLRAAPPENWRRLVLECVKDSSERVSLIAMELLCEQSWEADARTLERLALSTRPNLRASAAELLVRQGRSVPQGDYASAVLDAAAHVARQLGEAGFKTSDAIPKQAQADRALDSELLTRIAEQYLDTPPSRHFADSTGVLLLAAAVEAGQQRLVLRLWDREVSESDSDAEIVLRGFEALSRIRLLAALDACRHGDITGALASLAPLARAAADAPIDSAVRTYAHAASYLSDEIWLSHVGLSEGEPNTNSPVALASGLLEDLDLSQSADQLIARQRIDAWCGLRVGQQPARAERRFLAN